MFFEQKLLDRKPPASTPSIIYPSNLMEFKFKVSNELVDKICSEIALTSSDDEGINIKDDLDTSNKAVSCYGHKLQRKTTHTQGGKLQKVRTLSFHELLIS